MTSATCCAYNCGSKYGLEGVTFHRFPLDKSNILSKWLTTLNKPDWSPSKMDFLCSLHFTNDMFIEKGGYRFLKYDAIPTMFHVLPPAQALFPTQWPYRILTAKEVESKYAKGYVIEAKISLDNEEKFLQWIKKHESLAKVSYRLSQKFPQAGKNLLFKAEYTCRSILVNDKSTYSNCPAKLLVRIRTSIPSPKLKAKDDEDEQSSSYLCTVVLYHLHDHTVESNKLEVSNTLPEEVSEEVKHKFLEMFKGGYTLDEAFNTHLTDLREEYCDQFEVVHNDNYLCPDEAWLNKFHAAFVEKFGEHTDVKLKSILENEIINLNAGRGKAQLRVLENHTVVALCTSLMERVHSLKSSGELVFIVSTGFLERCKCYLYILMTYSCAEGLPLGALITTSDSEEALKTGFELLANMLPEKAFGQYGKMGPEVFLTANQEQLQNAIQTVFPESMLLICSFRLLKDLWVWLWDPENGINEDDHCHLFSLTYMITKMKSIDEFTQCYNATFEDETVKKYPNFQKYLREIKDLSEKWAISVKNEIIDKNKEVSAIEIGSQVLKDKMYLTKTYSLVNLLSFLSTELESHYKQKIIHCINNTLDTFANSSYKQEMKMVEGTEVQHLNSGQFKVTSLKKQTFYVDMTMCICSCPLGMQGARCKHQYAVYASKMIDIISTMPEDEIIKKELNWIATNSLNNLLANTEPASGDSDMDYDIVNDDEYTPRQEVPKKTSKTKTKKSSPKEEAKSILDRVIKDIINRYERYPVEYHKAIVSVAVNYQSLQHDDAILAALRNFGQNLSADT